MVAVFELEHATMNPTNPTLRTLALGLGLLCTAPLAWSADPLSDAMTQAYAPYRAALFRTNSQAQAESVEAIAKARDAWRGVVAGHANAAPAPYDRDPAVKETLLAVQAVYDKAAAQIAERQLAETHQTLEAARDLMSDLRRRNGVVVFSDHMNAYHAQMEVLLKQGPKLLADTQGLMTLAGDAGALSYLAQRLSSEAPPALRAQPEFGTLLQGVLDSVGRLQSALRVQDAAGAKAALEQLKKPYSLFFLKFG